MFRFKSKGHTIICYCLPSVYWSITVAIMLRSLFCLQLPVRLGNTNGSQRIISFTLTLIDINGWQALLICIMRSNWFAIFNLTYNVELVFWCRKTFIERRLSTIEFIELLMLNIVQREWGPIWKCRIIQANMYILYTSVFRCACTHTYIYMHINMYNNINIYIV